jgi:hypothetical protein
VSVSTGNSTSGNSGNITLQTGTAGGVRGSVVVNSAVLDYSNQGMQAIVFENNATAYSMGATGALNMLVLDTRNTVEQVVVNAAKGIGLPNNNPLILGTAANDVFTLSYVSGTNTGTLAGTIVTAADALAVTRPFVLRTGAAVNSGGGGGGATGNLTISTGTNDVSGAGTAGASGTISISTGGNTSSGAGTSGNSGPVQISTGGSDDASTGQIQILTGNAAAVGGVNSGNASISTGAVGGVGTTGNITLSTGNAAGAGVSGNIALTPGTTVAGTRGHVTATGLQTVSDGAAAIAAARTMTLADSGGVFSVSQAGAYDIDLPSPVSGPGCRYLFYLGTAAANSVTITVLGAAATFVGTIVNDVTSVLPATGSTLTFVTGTAALGDTIEIVSISTTLYLVRAVSSTAGGITIA